jgi:hypothetical protein
LESSVPNPAAHELRQLFSTVVIQVNWMPGQQNVPVAMMAPVFEEAQLLPGAWGIGVSQETRPEGISYKVRVCVKGKARYLGR